MPIKLLEDSQSNLRIRYEIPSASLFELTYLSADLMELTAISDEVEFGRGFIEIDPIFDDIDDEYYYRRRLSRSNMLRAYERNPDAFRISTLRIGSLEIALAAAGVVAAVVIPFTILYIEQRLKNTEIAINVETSDKSVRDLLEMVEKNQFGTFREAMPILRDILARKGHDFVYHSPDFYRIIERNANRTIRTLQSTYRIRKRG